MGRDWLYLHVYKQPVNNKCLRQYIIKGDMQLYKKESKHGMRLHLYLNTKSVIGNW